MDEEIGTLMALKIFQVHKELSFPGGGYAISFGSIGFSHVIVERFLWRL